MRPAKNGRPAAEAEAPSLSDPDALSVRVASPALDSQAVLHKYVALLEDGISPQAACQTLGVTRDEIRAALAGDPALQSRADGVHDVLSENVLSALYQTATKGNVTAMSVWLKAHPPPGWGDARDQAGGPATFDEILKGLTDNELRELERTLEGVVLD